MINSKIIVSILTVASITCACNLKNSNNKTEENKSESINSIRNKEAREDSIKLAEAFALQSKFSNIVTADFETPPVKSNLGDDAADDPAIWINKKNPEKSLIIGTNKTAGLNVYNLQGEELQFVEIGKINNADVSYGFNYNGKKVDIVAGTNRSNNSIDVLIIDGENQKLIEKPICTIPSTVDDVYGICMYHDTKNKKHYVYSNGKNGKIEQWLLKNKDNTVEGELVRSFWVNSQPEGMVVDLQTNTLFVGVEEDAIYKYIAHANADTTATKIARSSATGNPNISYDIEGLTIYRTSKDNGYLIASIQGSFSYAIFDLSEDNNYITSFIIKDGDFDGVEETDGLDVSAIALGEKFPKGILVVQDGFNKDNGKDVNQNFKIVSFEKVLQFLN